MTVPAGYALGPLAPELVLLASAVAALFVHIFAGRKGRRAAGSVALAGIGAAALALALTPPSAETLFGGHFVADAFALFVKAVVLLAGALSVVLAFRFFDVEGGEPGEAYTLMLLAMVGMCAAASAADVVTTYVAFELFAIPSYILAGIFKKERRSAEAGIKYFFLGTLSSAIMLLGLGLVFGLSGATSYAGAGPALAASGGTAVLAAMGLVFAGLFFKAAFVPFHMWAPDVYEGAPTPLAVFLSTAPKAAVVAVLVRAMTALFGGQAAAWSAVLQVVAVATMLWGNLAAMTQKSLKRMLGYSAIAHAGTLAIGLAAWGDTGRTAVLFYLAVYVVMNAAAFGLLLLVDGGGRFDETVDGLRGLVRRAPVAAASVLVILLALAGIPPTAGFMGKYFLLAAAVGKGLVPLAAVGALNSVLSLFYYFRIGRAMFLEEGPSGSAPSAGRVSLLVTVFLAVAAAALLLLGLLARSADHPGRPSRPRKLRRMSMKPTAELSHEHISILTMIRILGKMADRFDAGDRIDPADPAQSVEFLRIFADKCHHAKEEGHLFPEMEKVGVVREGGPIGVMLAEHVEGRKHVAAMAATLEGLGREDIPAARAFAAAARRYGALLTQHIFKEDHVLYPMADARFSADQQRDLAARFAEVEKAVVGEGRHEEFHRLLERLAAAYSA